MASPRWLTAPLPCTYGASPVIVLVPSWSGSHGLNIATTLPIILRSGRRHSRLAGPRLPCYLILQEPRGRTLSIACCCKPRSMPRSSMMRSTGRWSSRWMTGCCCRSSTARCNPWCRDFTASLARALLDHSRSWSASSTSPIAYAYQKRPHP
jgi:hypothetical protein